jgi:hypothetical protein
VARFNLSREEATALAASLTTSLGQDDQDPTPIPPVRDYREEFARVVAESLGISTATAAEGLGLRSRRGRRGGQGRGNRPQSLPDNGRPSHTQPTQSRQSARRPASPTPPGFEHNRGPAYIPFRIRTNTGGETPARYIRAHLDAPNPFVEGRLSINGPTYHSEIHAAPIVDIDIAPPLITAELLRLLDTDYMGHDNVDEAIGLFGPRSIGIGGWSASARRSRSRSDAWRIRCSLRMWRGGCVSADWKRRGLWYVFRRRCRVTGKHFVCLRGRWNVGVYPEKGMMSRF